MMRHFLKPVGLITAMLFMGASLALAAPELKPLKPRVVGKDRRIAKKMKNPIAFTKANVAKGKSLYEGKGTCLNCHGKSGKGDGPAGKVLPQGPRNFTNCKFHKKRKDGELFYVIKNGSKGPKAKLPSTGMVSLIPSAITEEQAWYIINYERSFCKKWAKKLK